MGQLTESEIFEFMQENFRLAAENCVTLSIREGGFIELRKQLRYLDGCSRQAAAWREDARWLAIAAIVGQASQEVGSWVRAKQYGKFVTLRNILLNGEKACMDLKDKATGRAGAILPIVQAEPMGRSKPVSVILPDDYKSVH